MLRGRNRQLRIGAQRFISDHGTMVAGEQQFAGLLLESQGPVIGFRLMSAPCVGMEIVHKVAAARDASGLGCVSRLLMLCY